MQPCAHNPIRRHFPRGIPDLENHCRMRPAAGREPGDDSLIALPA